MNGSQETKSRRVRTLNPAEVLLEIQCPECEGESLRCEVCNGTGTVPTELGRHLLRFISSRMQTRVNY